MVSKIL